MAAPTLHPDHWHHVRTTAAVSGFAGMIGGWHWRGRTALAADLAHPAALAKIAVPCDDQA
jgi:hypothetical protein